MSSARGRTAGMTPPSHDPLPLARPPRGMIAIGDGGSYDVYLQRPADFDCSGDVGFVDLTVVLANWDV